MFKFELTIVALKESIITLLKNPRRQFTMRAQCPIYLGFKDGLQIGLEYY